METYNVGTQASIISFAADINTIDLAASRAILVDITSNAPGISVAHSTNASGDIALTNIGNANNIKGKRLSIFSKIDLLGPDKESRKKAFDAIDANYTLSGGSDGLRNFSNPGKTAVNDEFTALFLNKLIDLI